MARGSEREVLSAGTSPWPTGRVPWRRPVIGLIVAVLAGAFLGAVGMRAWDTRPSPSTTPSPSPPSVPELDLRVSLGARVGGLNGVEQGKVIVTVDTVVENAGSQPLVLVGIDVDGPGAGFVADPAGGPPTGLPVPLPAGEFVAVRFGLSSDCRVAVRPEPRVSLRVEDRAGVTHDVVARIPDLDILWGQSLAPEACLPGR